MIDMGMEGRRVAASAGGDATVGDGGGGVSILLGRFEANLICCVRNRKGCACLKGGSYAQILS